jgi:hypothetical protein
VPDTDKAARQDVLRKAAQKLAGRKSHGALLVAVRVVSPEERDLFAIEGQQAMIADGDAMGITAEIAKCLSRPAEGRSSRTCGDGQSAAGQVSARHARRMKAAARPARSTVTDDFRALPQTLTLTHYGRPRSVQAVGVSALVKLAQLSGGIVEMVVAVGDTVVELMPVLHVFGAREPVDETEIAKRN